MTTIVGIRGAVQAEADTAQAIDLATRELLEAIVGRNRLEMASIAAAWFTQTPDLTAVYPAASARGIGWGGVPMMCAQEAAVDGALPRTIRALVVARLDGDRPVRHVYLGETTTLRPDLDQTGAKP